MTELPLSRGFTEKTVGLWRFLSVGKPINETLSSHVERPQGKDFDWLEEESRRADRALSALRRIAAVEDGERAAEKRLSDSARRGLRRRAQVRAESLSNTPAFVTSWKLRKERARTRREERANDFGPELTIGRHASGGDRLAPKCEHRYDFQMDRQETAHVFLELHKGAKKWMRFSSYSDREDAVSKIMLLIVERGQQGRTFPLSYWMGAIRQEGIKNSYLRKNGKELLLIDDFVAWNGDSNFLWLEPKTQPMQLLHCEALEALRLCRSLPKIHQAAIYRRADGATPSEIATELQIEVIKVMDLLRQARTWLERL